MPTVARSGHSPASRRLTTNMKLIALRINAGYSRDDLARELGIGRETIRLAEAGFVPTPRIQFAIATHFDQLPLDIWPAKDQRRPARRRAA